MELGKLVISNGSATLFSNRVLFFLDCFPPFFFSLICPDFILCYEKCHIQNDDNIEQSGHGLDKISDPSERKKTKARRKFLKAIQAKGNYRLECETQHWKVRLCFTVCNANAIR